mmetsp:Transcript_28285/g.59072  ORF Transcript_28285/g.59072 Transcript_28285/m.59072 type:complete len:339 (-) Transcript_28285:842-1858(-)
MHPGRSCPLWTNHQSKRQLVCQHRMRHKHYEKHRVQKTCTETHFRPNQPSCRKHRPETSPHRVSFRWIRRIFFGGHRVQMKARKQALIFHFRRSVLSKNRPPSTCVEGKTGQYWIQLRPSAWALHHPRLLSIRRYATTRSSWPRRRPTGPRSTTRRTTAGLPTATSPSPRPVRRGASGRRRCSSGCSPPGRGTRTTWSPSCSSARASSGTSWRSGSSASRRPTTRCSAKSRTCAARRTSGPRRSSGSPPSWPTPASSCAWRRRPCSAWSGTRTSSRRSTPSSWSASGRSSASCCGARTPSTPRCAPTRRRRCAPPRWWPSTARATSTRRTARSPPACR